MYKIYSKIGCKFCDMAKALLTTRGLSYEEHTLDAGQEKQEGANYYTLEDLLLLVPNARTVPQIFSPEGDLIGGYDALKVKLQ